MTGLDLTLDRILRAQRSEDSRWEARQAAETRPEASRL